MIKLGYEVDIKNDIIKNSRHGNTKTLDDLDSAISKFNFDPTNTNNSQNLKEKIISLNHDLGRGALKGAAAGALVGGAMLLAKKRKAKESESNMGRGTSRAGSAENYLYSWDDLPLQPSDKGSYDKAYKRISKDPHNAHKDFIFNEDDWTWTKK